MSTTKNKMKPKQVDVSFFGDTDIDEFFITKDEIKENELKSIKKNITIKHTQNLLSKMKLDSDQPKLTHDLINDKMIKEQEIFSFRTPSKKDTMILKALEAASKRTPKSTTTTPNKINITPNKEPCTPGKRTPRRCLNLNVNDSPNKRTPTRGTPRRMTLLDSIHNTPQSVKCRKSLRDITRTPKKINEEVNITMPKTPYTLRTRIKKEIAKINLYNSDDSDNDFNDDLSASDSEYSADEVSQLGEDEEDESQDDENYDEDDNSDDDDVSSYIPSSMPSLKLKLSSTDNNISNTKKRIIKRNKKYNNDFNFIPTSDEYFSTNKCITSNNTLSRLEIPRFAQDKLNELLSQTENSHQEYIEGLFIEHTNMFSRWIFALKEGYNVLLYGVGSKIKLLHTFHQEYLKNHFVMVINGFFPSLTIKQILFSLAEDLLELTNYPRDLFECLDCIEKTLNNDAELNVYLIIHNLEGPMLRDNITQEILSRLSSIENVHLLGSVDHINAPLLWDQQTASRYNFTWWDVTSYQPYTSETSYESSLLVQQSGELGLASLTTLFHSLTSNAKKIFLLIVNYQLENKTSHYAGMPFKILYKASRQRFLVSTDMALRTQLKEYIDHQILKIKKSQEDASELILIPMEEQFLKEFVENYTKE